MAGKLNVYDLGQGGVNSSKSPIHLDTTELTKGQNAVLDTAGAQGGLLKRGGAPKLNSVAMQGKINGAIAVPVADESGKTQTLYVPLEVTSGSNTWRKSTDGSSWSFVTTPQKVALDTKRVNAGLLNVTVWQGVASLDGKLYYATDQYTVDDGSPPSTPPPIRVFDGTNDEPFFAVPYNPNVNDTGNSRLVLDIIAANKRIYFATADGTDGADTHSRVFEGNPATGQVRQIGADFSGSGEAMIHLAWYNNRLWVGEGRQVGEISSIRPGFDTAWTLEVTIASVTISSFAVFEGLLYCGLGPFTGNTPRTSVRSSLGAWTDTDTGGLSGTKTYTTGPLIVFNSKLYAVVNDGSTVLVREYDGSSWSTDEDLTSTFPDLLEFPQQAVVFKDELYLVTAELGGSGSPGANPGQVLKRTTGGTWTEEDTVSSRGWIGVVTA
ncbi:hypothetical protein LCGC14_0897320 [marine sediment metagenome]|uniref:Uncharacterized protein n=1 Tax=marine sediment metagenome TaxID=412755 RepID=A0A0F9RGJ1_9ZZZZ